MTGRIFESSALGRILTSSKDKIQNPEVLKAKELGCADCFLKKCYHRLGFPLHTPMQWEENSRPAEACI